MRFIPYKESDFKDLQEHSKEEIIKEYIDFCCNNHNDLLYGYSNTLDQYYELYSRVDESIKILEKFNKKVDKKECKEIIKLLRGEKHE